MEAVMYKLIRFSTDEQPAADPEAEKPKEVKSEWTPEQQAEFDRRAAALKKAAKAEAQAEFERKQKEAQAEAEKQRLAEQGEFKALAEKAQAEREEALQRADQSAKEAELLKAQINFAGAVSKLGYEFVNVKAQEDAFAKIDLSGDMEKEVESLYKEYSYYFRKPDTVTTDARAKGKSSSETTDAEKMEILKRIPALQRKPR
jgi:hypothetical protein